MIVGGLQGGDIALAHRAGIAQTLASPRKPLTPEPHHQKIRHQAGVTAVAVRERVNLHQPVMEAHRDLVGRIGLVFDPRFGVVEQLAQGDGNFSVERIPRLRSLVRNFPAHRQTSPSIRRCRSLMNFSLSGSRLRPSAQSCARAMFSCSASFSSLR